MKKMVLFFLALSLLIAGCAAPADVASVNLSTAADNFKITRRVVFINGITGEYILTVEGLCSLGNNDPVGELTVTCKTGEDEYKKHFLGLSDNVTYMVEQIDAFPASTYHYKVVFNPSTLIPDITIR